jgi:hypothetical protein
VDFPGEMLEIYCGIAANNIKITSAGKETCRLCGKSLIEYTKNNVKQQGSPSLSLAICQILPETGLI